MTIHGAGLSDLYCHFGTTHVLNSPQPSTAALRAQILRDVLLSPYEKLQNEPECTLKLQAPSSRVYDSTHASPTSRRVDVMPIGPVDLRACLVNTQLTAVHIWEVVIQGSSDYLKKINCDT